MENGFRSVPWIDTFIIVYMVMAYPLIPTNVSWRMIFLMAVPVVIKLLAGISSCCNVGFNKALLPLMIIPLLVAISGGLTAIAYAGKIAITLITVATLDRRRDKNYDTFLKVVRFNGVVVLVTLFFEFLFPTWATTLYTPIWNLYLRGDSNTLLMIISNAENGLVYGIIPSASYAVNALTFALGTYLINIKKRKNKIMAVLMYIGIFMTSKRSYMIFVTVTILALKFLIGNKKNKGKRILSLIFIVFSMLFVWIIIEPYITYSAVGVGKLLATIKYFNDPVYIEKYFIRAERDVLAEYAFQLFKENWVFGVGWGNFSKIYLQETGIWRLDAHNTYLQILCESGLFAALIILGVLYRELIRATSLLKRNRRHYYYVAYVIFFCSLISFTAFIFDLTQFYVTLFMCIYFMKNMSHFTQHSASNTERQIA